MACAAPICAAISTSSCSAGTAAATPQRPSTPCSASARASDPPTTATSSDNASDPGRPGASHRPPSDPPQLEPNTGPPACLTALETYFPKSKSSRTSHGTVRKPCLERRRTINIWCDRKQREKPFCGYRNGVVSLQNSPKPVETKTRQVHLFRPNRLIQCGEHTQELRNMVLHHLGRSSLMEGFESFVTERRDHDGPYPVARHTSIGIHETGGGVSGSSDGAGGGD